MSRWLLTAALLVAAFAYFWLGRGLTLEWVDEGHIVYPSWLVSQHALPYRDFRQLYGPSLFYLNAALFRAFGPDLAVIRATLVVVKVTLAILIFAVGRLVAPRPAALGLAAFFVVVWGAPLWLFNTPYAGHYALLLDLAGLLAFFRLPVALPLRCTAVGLAFGLAATFKLTAGVFWLVGFLVFLLFRQDDAVPASGHTWPIFRLVVLTGSLALFVRYMGRHLEGGTALVLLAPAVTTWVMLAREALRADAFVPDRRAIIGLLAYGVGMFVPIFAWAVFFASRGLGQAAVENLATGIPAKITWYVPFGIPDARTALVVLGLAGCLAIAATCHRWWLAVPVLAMAITGVVAGYNSGFGIMTLLPLTTVWIGLVPAAQHHAPAPFRALHLNAVATLVQLYPCADVAHALMLLPAFLPLMAWECTALDLSAGRHGQPWLTRMTVGIAIVLLARPFVEQFAAIRRLRPVELSQLGRATCVRDGSRRFADTAALVAYLHDQDQEDAPLLVIPSEQMVYFLAGRRSVADRDEFVFYLVSLALISDTDARALVDEDALIERLGQIRPMIVTDEGTPALRAVQHTFARLAGYVDVHYRPVARFGRYRVLTWTAG